MVRLRVYAIAAGVSALLFCGKAAAQTTDWTGVSSELWSDTGNWDDGLPSSANSVLFAVSATTTVDQSFTIPSLTVVTGPMVSINGTGPLTVTTSIANESSSTLSMSVPITLGSISDSNTVNLNGNLAFSGDITLASFSTTLQEGIGSQITIGGKFFAGSGGSNVTFSGAGGTSLPVVTFQGQFDPCGNFNQVTVTGSALVFDTSSVNLSSKELYIGSEGTPGYIGYTETTGFSPSQFLGLIDECSVNGVIGFDSHNPASPVNISSPIDLTQGGEAPFTSSTFLGTSTTAQLSGNITPVSASVGYQFTGINGGQLNVSTSLGDDEDSTGVTIGLPSPMGSLSSVILSGSNDYTGGTFLNSGILYVTNCNALGGSEGGTLSVNSTEEVPTPILAPFGGSVTLPNAIALNSNGLVLNINYTSPQLTLTGVICGSGTLYINGPTDLEGCNTFSGGTYVTGTTLTVGTNTGLGSGSLTAAESTVTFNSGSPNMFLPSLNASTLTFTVSGSPVLNELTMSNTSTINFAAGSTPTIQDLYSDTLSDSNLINLGSGGTTLTFQLGADPKFYGKITGMGSVVYDSPSGSEFDLESAFSDFNGGVTVESGGTFTTLGVGASSTGPGGSVTKGPLGTGTLTLGNNTTFTATSGTNATIGNNIVLGTQEGSDSVTLENQSSGSLKLLGTIADTSGGTGQVNVDGNLILAGMNTYAGGTTVLAGTLSLAHDSAGGAGASVTSGPVGLGTLTLASGTTLSTPAGTSATVGNNIILGTASTSNSVTIGSSPGQFLALLGTISDYTDGTGTVVINGTVYIEGANSYSGGTNLNSGTLYVTPGASLGAGLLTENDPSPGAVLAASGGPVTLSNNIQVNANGLILNKSGSPLLTLNGVISDVGSFDPITVNGPVTLGGNNTYSGGTTVTGATVTVATNSGLGTGSLALTGATVDFTNTSGSPILDGLSMAGGSVINFEGGLSPTIENMSSDTSSSDQINLGVGGVTSTALTVDAGGDPTFMGTINGTGSLAVASSGGFEELDLSGANTYTVGTTVGSNVLLVAKVSSALGTGPLVLNSGAIFGTNTGVTIANAITVNPGASVGGYGTIAPATPQSITFGVGSGVVGGRGTIGGDSGLPIVGTLNFGSTATVVFGPGSGMQFSMQTATNVSSVVAAGTVDVTANPGDPFTVAVVGVDATNQITGTASSFDNTTPQAWTLISANTLTISGGFNALDFTVDTSNFSNSLGSTGGNFFVTQGGTGNDSLILNFSPVPEPSTWALMAGGLCVLVAGAVRRRRRA